MSSQIDPETVELAKKFVDHVTNKDGEILANVYESQAFKAIYDPNGAEARKLRLPRKQLQVHNQYDAQKHLFQKVYYHPALLQSDEQRLRDIFNAQSAAHDSLSTYTSLGWFAAFWPATYSLSRSVKPSGCFVFFAAYVWSYYNVVKPFTVNRLQGALNAAAQPYATKYGIKGDEAYMK